MSRKGFSTRKGRPRTRVSAPDKGTPELRAKRAAGLTDEAIDLCRKRELISESEYWCALHFRWLYTLRFGSPGIQAMDLLRSQGKPPPSEDDPWRYARNQEYRQAACLLEEERTLVAVLRVAVFDDTTPVLSCSTTARDSLRRLRQGLASLQRHWQGAHPIRQLSGGQFITHHQTLAQSH